MSDFYTSEKPLSYNQVATHHEDKLSFIKKPIRRFIYPFVIPLLQKIQISRHIPKIYKIIANQYFWGEKGTDYVAQKRLINHYKKIKNKNVLVYGAGLGFDTISILPYKPKKLLHTTSST